MQSKAYRIFKKEMGQANHFFITIIVGLYEVKKEGKKVEKDPSIKECWNPKDVTSSVERSERFTKKAALALVVENIEMYFKLVNKKPVLLSEELKNIIDGTQWDKQSVSAALDAYCEYFPSLDMTKISMVKLMLAWRNKVVHYDADNTLDEDKKRHLLSLSSPHPLIDKYHLNIEEMLDHFDSKTPPSRKELETMISYSIHFIEELDRLIVEQAPKVQYVDSLIRLGLKDRTYTYSYMTTDNCEKKVSIIKKWLKSNYNVSSDFYNDELDNHIREIVLMKKDELSNCISGKN